MKNSSTGRGMGVFLVIWLGQMVSTLGTGLTGFALGVKVFQETESVTRYALIGLSVVIPGLLLSPLVGVLADRFNRRLVLVLANVGSALANVVLYGLIVTGRLELWHVYPVIVVSSAFAAFVWPTFIAATTLLVGKEHFVRASGMNQMGASLSQILAPALAGVLLGVIGLGGIVLINLCTYLVAVVALVLVRFPAPRATAAGEAARGTVRQQTGHAWGFIRERPGFLRLLFLFAGVNFGVTLLTVLLTPLVLSFATAVELGLVLTVASSGTLVGSILMSVWGGPRRRVPPILGLITVLGFLAFAAALEPSATLVASVAFLFMLGFPILTSLSQAIWQSKVPADLQGRVFAVRRMVAGLAAPVAFIVAGPLADHVFEPLMASGGPLALSLGRAIGFGPGRGIALMIIALGVVLLSAALAGGASRPLRRLEDDVPDAVPDERPAEERRERRPAETLGALGPAQVAVIALVLLLGAVAPIVLERPPHPPGEDAAAGDFSALRARRHLDAVAARPHPVGSPEQRRVRDYLVGELRALGLDPEVERAVSVLELETPAVTQVVAVENVVARLAGREPGRGSVLLVAHYDSIPTAPGGSDNGAAVAALLETARALGQGDGLRNDVVFLFSDSEEVGRHGVRAFVKESPLAGDVKVVLNFDARGHGGPVFMFQGGGPGRRWIPRFIAGALHPRGNALFSHVYQLLPNDTDFTVFLENGYAGFNFAFIEGLTHYHTALDRAEDVDLASLQHQGSYALSLVRSLGDLDLGEVGRDVVGEEGDGTTYFSVLGDAMVSYPKAVGLVLAVVAGGGFLVLLVSGLGRRRLTLFGVGQGFLALLGATVAIPVAITLVWLVARDTSGVSVVMGSVSGAALFMAAFACLAVAAVALLHRFLRTFVGVLDLAAGALLWWLLMTVLASGPWLPIETGFLFAWPLAFALPAFAYLLRTPAGEQRPWTLTALLVVAALPGLLLWSPFIATLYVGLQSVVELGGVALLPVAFVGGLLVPQLDALCRRRAWLPALGITAGVVCLAVAWQAGRSAPSLDLSSVLYTHDADRGESAWFSFDRRPGPWTREFGFEAGEKASFARFYPPLRGEVLVSPAPPAGLPLPEAEEVTARAEGELVRVDLRLAPSPGTRARLLWLEPAEEVVSARLGETEVSLRAGLGGQRRIVMELPAEAGELSVLVRGGAPVTLTVIEQHEGLPPVPGTSPRPDDELPRSFLAVIRSDVTLVRRSFELPLPEP